MTTTGVRQRRALLERARARWARWLGAAGVVGALVVVALAIGCSGGGGGDGGATTDGPPVARATADGAPLVAFVGDEVPFDGGASVGAASYRWIFGDGETSTDGRRARASHVYTRAGHYTASLVVTAASGETASDSVPVTVVYAPLAERPPRSTTIDGDEDGGRVYVVMTDFDAVAVIDEASREVVAHLTTCARPTTLSHARAAEVLVVACNGGDAVEVFDTATLVSRGRVVLPRASQPYGVAVTVDGAAAYVTLQALGQVAEVALDGDAAPSLVRTLDVLPDARAISIDPPEDALVVTRFRSPPDHGEWAHVDLPDGRVQVFELPFELGPDSDTTSRGVPTLLEQVTIVPSGRRGIFTGQIANVARGLHREGQPLTFETTARAVLRSVWLDASAGELGGGANLREVFNDRDRAVAAAFNPLGDLFFVGHSGAGLVDALDAFTFDPVGFFDVGAPVDGLWVTRTGDELWVSAGIDRQAIAYDLAGELVADRSDGVRVDLTPPRGEVLAADALRGKRIFHGTFDRRMTKDRYLTCASCHPDGAQDGRIWDFTQLDSGLRNSQTLLGAPLDGPLHWNGDFDEIQDFETGARRLNRGQGFLADADFDATEDPLGPPKAGRSADLDALAAYVRSLAAVPVRSPFRTPEGTLTAAAERGRRLFLSAAVGCAGCHAPPAFTDSRFTSPGQPLLHDVGTIEDGSGTRRGEPVSGFDTPSLRGVWASAPYLHDGSAETLREVVVERNRDDLHGRTSALRPEEVDDLVEFLRQIE